MTVMNAINTTIATKPTANPALGDYYYDSNKQALLVWIGNSWQETYMSSEKHMDRISTNQFTCTNTLSTLVDGKIKQIGLNSIKKSRKFNKVLYTISDETELNIFNVYFNELIK